MVVKKSIRYFKFTTKYLNINLEKHTLLFSIISQFLKKSSSMTKNLTNLKLMLEELDLNGVDATLSADIKLLITHVAQM